MSRRLFYLFAATTSLVVATGAGPAVAAAPPGGCAPGGPYELISVSVFPPEIAEIIDQNRDGLACGLTFKNRDGGIVIDNTVQART